MDINKTGQRFQSYADDFGSAAFFRERGWGRHISQCLVFERVSVMRCLCYNGMDTKRERRSLVMDRSNREIMDVAMAQSAIDLNCSPQDFGKTENVVVVSEKKDVSTMR